VRVVIRRQRLAEPYERYWSTDPAFVEEIALTTIRPRCRRHPGLAISVPDSRFLAEDE
jgi:hypothetical protein